LEKTAHLTPASTRCDSPPEECQYDPSGTFVSEPTRRPVPACSSILRLRGDTVAIKRARGRPVRHLTYGMRTSASAK